MTDERQPFGTRTRSPEWLTADGEDFDGPQGGEKLDGTGVGQNLADNVINEAGPLFVHYLFSASKTVQVHDLQNRATQRVLSDLMEPLARLFASEGEVTLGATADYLFINDTRLNMDSQNFGPMMYMLEALRDREVEAIDFNPDVTPVEVGQFLKVFFGDVPDEDVFNQLESVLSSRGITGIRMTQWVERERQLTDHSNKDKNVRQESTQVFFRTVLLMGEVLRGIEQKRVLKVRKAERLTQQMVDIVQADESILLGLTSIKNFDAYTFAHSVNVCVLSMLIGDRLKLFKSDIARLGVAALMHDIGKTYVPQTILNKPGKLDDKEWELMKYHTFFGVKELSRVKSLREVADGLFASLQHHIHFDGNGYPQKPGGWNVRLFTRIVSVADYFDAMTTPRVYKKNPLTPDRALRFILQKSGTIFDPFIAKVFIQAMGMYPIGSVVEFDTGERGIVVKQNGTARFIHRPLAILRGADGTFDAESDPVDISETGNGPNGYRRSIVRALYDEEIEREKINLFASE